MSERSGPSGTRLWLLGLVLTLAVAAGLSQLASADPDGLERAAEDHGFADAAREHDLAGSPLADYAVAGVEDDGASVALAGVAGVAATGALAGALLWLARRRSGGSPPGPTADPGHPPAR